MHPDHDPVSGPDSQSESVVPHITDIESHEKKWVKFEETNGAAKDTTKAKDNDVKPVKTIDTIAVLQPSASVHVIRDHPLANQSDPSVFQTVNTSPNTNQPLDKTVNNNESNQNDKSDTRIVIESSNDANSSRSSPAGASTASTFSECLTSFMS